MYLGDPPHTVTAAGFRVKIRDTWSVGILALLTLGLYPLVWFYKVNRELDDYAFYNHARRVGGNPVLAVVGITVGGVFVLPALVTWIWFLIRVSRAQEHAGVQGTVTPWYVVAIYLLSIVPFAGPVIHYEWLQLNLNFIWQRRSAGEPLRVVDTFTPMETLVAASS